MQMPDPAQAATCTIGKISRLSTGKMKIPALNTMPAPRETSLAALLDGGVVLLEQDAGEGKAEAAAAAAVPGVAVVCRRQGQGCRQARSPAGQTQQNGQRGGIVETVEPGWEPGAIGLAQSTFRAP
jgi:hypothetical protein